MHLVRNQVPCPINHKGVKLGYHSLVPLWGLESLRDTRWIVGGRGYFMAECMCFGLKMSRLALFPLDECPEGWGEEGRVREEVK